MAFTGGERLGKVFGDEGRREAGPGAEMVALDCAKKRGWRWAEGTSVKESGEVLFGFDVADGTMGGVA
jgi:hypothetical protein